MATEADVRKLCLAMPGVTERSSWNMPAWFAKTLMARMWEAGVLTVKTAEREALTAADPGIYFRTPHHDRSPHLILVRLTAIGGDELEELLQESYRIAGGTLR